MANTNETKVVNSISAEEAKTAREAKAAERKRKIEEHKKRTKIHKYVRFGVQIVFFLLFPAAFTAAFAGVKYIFTQMGTNSVIELNSFICALIALLGFTFVFGRFFCGFACAFGSFGDWVHAIFLKVCEKLKKKPPTIKENIRKKLTYVKYFVLAIICILCFAGIYSSLSGTSPWDVFSMFTALNFNFSGYGIGIAILVIITIGMCLQERFFCRFLCPLGAIFSILPVLPFFSLRRNRTTCLKGCNACTKQCPSDIALSDTLAWENAGDCFQCQKCIDTCPKNNMDMSNVGTGIKGLKGNEVVFTLVRAALLVAVLKFAGI